MLNIPLPIKHHVSKFFKDPIPITTTLEPQSTLFKNLFLITGRVTNLSRIICWHPTYYEKYFQTYNYIMREDGPIPFYLRHYIAVIASARFKCKYLVERHENDFLNNGGDPLWIQDVKYLPPKISQLLEINSILAHQPWKLEPKHIRNLVNPFDAISKWSMSELVHALVIMATFRALSGMVLGMGVHREINVNTFVWPMESSTPKSELSKSLESNSVEDPSTEELSNKLKAKFSVDDSNQTDDFFEAAGDKETEQIFQKNDWGPYHKYIYPFPLQHEDFDVRAKEYSIFHVEDYSWDQQAYELLQRHYDCASLLDSEFSTIFDLTYNQINDQKNIDTAPFRRSLWYYVNRIQGILYDDYDYGLVNVFMNRNMKTFVKKLVYYPDTITLQSVSNMGYNLFPEEKCHIALLSTEARKQSELMYGLRAISQYMSSTP